MLNQNDVFISKRTENCKWYKFKITYFFKTYVKNIFKLLYIERQLFPSILYKKIHIKWFFRLKYTENINLKRFSLKFSTIIIVKNILEFFFSRIFFFLFIYAIWNLQHVINLITNLNNLYYQLCFAFKLFNSLYWPASLTTHTLRIHFNKIYIKNIYFTRLTKHKVCCNKSSFFR